MDKETELTLDGYIKSVPKEEYVADMTYNTPYVSSDVKEKKLIDYDVALARSLPTTKIWNAIKYHGSDFLNKQNDYVDPNFKPLDEWKKSGLPEETFKDIVNMDNKEQFNEYVAWREYYKEAEDSINASGFKGQATAFIAQAITDPTTYVGFGSAAMLSKGMAAYKVLAISGAAGGAAYEAIQQSTDLGNLRSTADSLFTIGAAGTIGMALGGAGPLFSKLASKVGKSSKEAAVQTVLAVDGLEDNVAKALSADVVAKSPELTQVSGRLPRFLAKAYSLLAPVLKGQTAKFDETRRAFAKMYGTTLETVGNKMGVPTEMSLNDAVIELNKTAKGKLNDLAMTVNELQKSGIKIDDDFYRRAIAKINDFEDELIDGSAESTIAKKMLDMGQFIAKNAEGMDDFAARQRFFPTVYSSQNISMNMKLMKEKMITHVRNYMASSEERISFLKSKISSLYGKESKEVAAQITKLDDELTRLTAFRSMDDTQVNDMASMLAEKFRSGEFTEASVMMRDIDKKIPSHFKERLLDQKDMIDFIEVNPFKVYSVYYRDAIPHVASYKTFGKSTPEAFINDAARKLEEKLPSLSGKEKIAAEKEILLIKKDLISGWNGMSGAKQIAAKNLYGDTGYNLAKTAKNFTAFTSLGSVAFTNITEFAAAGAVHGISQQKRLMSTLKSIVTSDAVRNVSKQDAKLLSNGMNLAAHLQLANAHTDEFINYGLGKNSVTSKMSAGASYINHMSQMAYGNVTWTKWMRDLIQISRQGAIYDSVKMLKSGELKGNRLSGLAKLGIGKEHADSILAQSAKYGEDVDGVFFFHLDQWDDVAAKQVVTNALNRDVRAISIDPQAGDVPHLFTVPGVDLLFQLKSWAVTAGHTYGIASLQKIDADHLAGMTAYIGFGAGTYMLAEIARGNKPPTDLDEILYAGVTNTGVLGIMPDYGGHYLMNRWFDIESGGAKYSEKQDWKSLAGGAFYSKLGDIQGVATPFFQMIDPDKEFELNNKFWKDALDVMPVPFVKPYVKNHFLSNEQ